MKLNLPFQCYKSSGAFLNKLWLTLAVVRRYGKAGVDGFGFHIRSLAVFVQVFILILIDCELRSSNGGN